MKSQCPHRVWFLRSTPLLIFSILTACTSAVNSAQSVSVVNLRKPLVGSLRVHEVPRSRFLPTRHTVLVCLPQDYDSDSTRRYPVLYMQDGQGLFSGAVDFALGTGWHLDETAERLTRERTIKPCIVVGIASEAAARDREYTPSPLWWWFAGSGEAGAYGEMLVREIKPMIDSAYRTKPDRANTTLGGASFGALAALWIAMQHPSVFGSLALLSPSVWWNNYVILSAVRTIFSTENATKPHVWLSVGTNETPQYPRFVLDMQADARRLRDTLFANGWPIDSNGNGNGNSNNISSINPTLHYAEIEGALHDDQAWRTQMEAVLRWIFAYP